MQVPRPVHNLPVCVMRLLSAERRPTDETFEHDSAHRPPIASKVVSIAAEDLGGNVIGSTHSGVSELPAGLSPGVDLGAVADCQLNLVQIHGIAVVSGGLVGSTSQEFLVIRCFVFLVETSRQTEIGQLDVAAAVQ